MHIHNCQLTGMNGVRASIVIGVGQVLFAIGEPLAGGVNVGEVYRWRDAAWSEVRRRLGQ
jgi:hypothetical protein